MIKIRRSEEKWILTIKNAPSSSVVITNDDKWQIKTMKTNKNGLADPVFL